MRLAEFLTENVLQHSSDTLTEEKVTQGDILHKGANTHQVSNVDAAQMKTLREVV